MTEDLKNYWRQMLGVDVTRRFDYWNWRFARESYGPSAECQERDDGKVKMFGYWVGNQDAKQFVKTGVGSTWAEALEQAFNFAEGQK